MIINRSTFEQIRTLVLKNINVAVILNKEKLYSEFGDINIFLQKNIIFNSIAQAKIEKDTIDPSEITKNYVKELGSEVVLADDVPDSLILELFDYFKAILYEQREFFAVDLNQTGRYDLLFKGILHNIKLIKTNMKSISATDRKLPKGIKNISLEKTVYLYFDKLIDLSIQFCICYEADNRNNRMCIEILNKNFKSYYKYQYRLDERTHARLKEDIDLIIHHFSHKDQYTCEIQFTDYKTYLENTIEMANMSINTLIEHNVNSKTKDIHYLIMTYQKIYQNSKERFKSPKKTSAFFQTLKKCNMDHRIEYNDLIIFPYLYDLIVMSFAYSSMHIRYKDTFIDSNKVAKIFNAYKYSYIERDSDENYHFNEFIRATEEIPQEYKKLDDPTILMIKHYSEILNCKYTTLASLFRQLRFQFPDHEKSVYNLLLPQRNINLNFDNDYFRKLSLYII